MVGVVYVCWSLVKNPKEYYLAALLLMLAIMYAALLLPKITKLYQKNKNNFYSDIITKKYV